MKCPCCGGETEYDFIAFHNLIVYKGRQFAARPYVIRMLKRLLDAPDGLQLGKTYGTSLATCLSEIRSLLRDAKIPMELVLLSRSHRGYYGVYKLVRTDDVQGKRDSAEHPQNVHTRS